MNPELKLANLLARSGAWLLVCLALLLGGAKAHAVAADLAGEPLLPRFHHTAWNARHGAPSDILALAQTADGWLWIGSPTGLYRFDGVSFERMDAIGGQPLPSGNILSLRATPTGGLWVGFRFGGASLFEGGKAWHYTKDNGLPRGSLQSIDVGPDGAVWFAVTGGVARLKDGKLEKIGPEQGLDAIYTNQVLADRAGNVFVASSGRGTYFRPRGEARFRKALQQDDEVGMTMAPDGMVWVVQGALKVYRYDQAQRELKAVLLSGIPLNRSEILFDRGGGLWSVVHGGIRRVLVNEPGQPRQVLTTEQGLSGQFVLALLEDREGNVWLGGSGGLDRIRYNKLTNEPSTDSSLKIGLAADKDGTLWLGSDMRLIEIRSSGERIRHPLRPIHTLLPVPEGGVWVGTEEAVHLYRKGKEVASHKIPAEAAGNATQALALDGEGGLWVAIIRKGVYRYHAGQWLHRGGYAELPEQTPIYMHTDVRGRLWLGYTNNLLVMLDQGKVTRYEGKDGVNTGNILSIAEHDGRIWIGGEKQVAYLDGQRFVPFRGEDGEFRGVSGMVVTADGELWLHGIGGVSRIQRADLQQALRDRQPVRYTRYDYEDGLLGVASQLALLPSLVEGKDGRLWAVTQNGIAWINPRQIRHNPLAPPVQITQLSVGNTRYEPRDKLALPEGTHSLQINFTALGMTIPERVHFRYQLEGVDAGWQSSGSRRQAFYTNLADGQYRFRVYASNEDGVWNQQGATLDFTIKPTFVQTIWFKLLCGLIALLLLYAFYALRVQQITRHLRERLQERVAERARIARALHDTLLQGVQGLVLRFHVISRQIEADPTAAKLQIEQALLRADELIAEGRDQVMNLRAHHDISRTLPDILGELTSVLAEEFDLTIELVVEGAPRALTPTTCDEAYGLGREALLNACRHAKASQIEVRLIFAHDTFFLQVSDDGQGMEPAMLAAGNRPGHWGLVGMKERASKVGGQLQLSSQPGQGTHIVFTVSARIAYAPAATLGRWGWLRRQRPTEAETTS